MTEKNFNAKVSRWLEKTSDFNFSLFAVAAAFTTYFCMYAFRKPFAVAEYKGIIVWGLELKIALIVGQLFGYALSKCLGVKILSELKAQYRIFALLGMIFWAELALVLFAISPPEGKVIAIFFNGLPLGAVWGVVFGCLEGRKTSELLGAGLSCSYIIASGAVKSAGKFWLGQGISESWMPALTGLTFLPLFFLAAWALSRLPSPSEEDVAARTVREPMNHEQRKAFVKRFFPGLFFLTFLYFFLTAYRDFRDNFAAEIWAELGWKDAPEIFTYSELPIAFIVMVSLAILYRVKDNRKGLVLTHKIMIAGSILIGVSTLLFDFGIINGAVWMILVGLGLYLGYVPYGCVLFDRLIAAVGFVATAVFMIYVTDSVGYIGSVGINLYKNFGQSEMSKLAFFRIFSYGTSIICTVCFFFSMIYFSRVTKKE